MSEAQSYRSHLIEQLHELRIAYQKAAQPILDELARIESFRVPRWAFIVSGGKVVPIEQWSDRAMTPEREILQRLVELKDRKNELDAQLSVLPFAEAGPTLGALRQYRREKDQAWADARALLEGNDANG